jgi:HK97 family phage major capsid protein
MKQFPRITAVALASAPRGLIAARAETNAAAMLAELGAGFEDFKRKYEGRHAELEAAINGLAVGSAAVRLGAGVSAPVEPEYTAQFSTYLRAGEVAEAFRQANASGWRQTVHAAMSIGDQSSGGYLAPTEWDRKVNENLIALSPMRSIAQVQGTGVNAYSTLWNNRGTASGWVGETDNRPQTNAPTLSPLTFDHGEIYANPAITQRLLDDAQFDVVSFIAGNVAEQFAVSEGTAFINGDGSNKPRGLLTYVTGGASDAHHPGGNLVTVTATGTAGALTKADDLVSFFFSHPAPYRSNSSWLMNSATAAAIMLLKDSQGRYLWQPSLQAGSPPTLLSRPVVIDENMPTIATGAFPIAFGDFQRGYLINDRMGTRVLRDPYTAKPYVLFYSTKRVGAGVLDPKAIRLFKIN